MKETPFIRSFEGRYFLYHTRLNNTFDFESIESPELGDASQTKLVFSSMVRFNGIPKFVQLAMTNLVNEIAVGELRKYCEDGRMHAGGAMENM